MGILGLTHDENGAALERLPVTIKVAIGEGPQPGEENGHPRRLDHFVFKRKTLRGQDVVWEPAADIAEAFGEKPTELGIIFLNDDPREVLHTEYAWWTPTGCKCHGELVQIENGDGSRYEMRAVRRTQKHPEGEPWPGNYKYLDGTKKGQPVPLCGDGCPDLERRDCRPSGDLYFILEKFPTLGAVCRIHTSSYRSVRNLSNGLMQIRRFNGGHLAGIKAVLKATPERISYSDKEGLRHSSVAHILSLEIGATDIPGLVASMNEPTRLSEQGRGRFGASGKARLIVREEDAERASEIAAEFYPDNDTQPSELAELMVGPTDEDEQCARICDLARKLGYNEAQIRMKLGQWAENLAGLERELLNELDDLPEQRDFGGRGKKAKRARAASNEARPLDRASESPASAPVWHSSPLAQRTAGGASTATAALAPASTEATSGSSTHRQSRRPAAEARTTSGNRPNVSVRATNGENSRGATTPLPRAANFTCAKPAAAGNCACEVKNPRGKCCLGDVAQIGKDFVMDRSSDERS